MSLKSFRATGFRCLTEASFTPHPALNLIAGPNASGKTSLLEAIYYLGRGRSFRASSNRELVQTGGTGFALYGQMDCAGREHRIGIEIEAGQRRVRVDGENGVGADLARLLPVQAIDPEIHNLVQGGPEYRRRFLDWGVFHVKHSFLDSWRRYQQALRQRNSALRQGESVSSVQAWDAELVAAGESVAALRADYFADYLSLFSSISSENLPFESICSYRRGWPENMSLAEALQQSWSRDQAMRSTQVGPHRADLAIQVQERRARYRVSRGQQKLLAATLVIAQMRFVAGHGLTDLVLLVDDPAAELDKDNRRRLFGLLQTVPAQLFVAALEPDDFPAFGEGLKFHVEHGELSSLL